MANYWVFILKVSVIFSTLYGIYWLFLRKNTFHNINRLLLLLILIASVIIPNLEFSSTEYIANNNVYNFDFGKIDEMVALENIRANESTKHSLNLWKVISYLYGIGLLFFLLKSIIQLIKIFSILKQSKKIIWGKQKIVMAPNNLPPFSFFHWIFLPEDEYSKAEMNPIIEHESVHARQWHTIDLLLTELFCIYLWFVPFVYSFKNSIKSVHEYLADKKVIRDKQTTIDYLKLLASNTEKYTLIGLSNNFYCSTLKNRITMMTKNKSSKLTSVKYLLLLPAVALLLQVFACNSENIIANDETNNMEPVSVVEKLPTYISPISDNYEMSWGYKKNIDPISKKERFHKAVDLKAKTGNPIMAIADGEVIKKADKPKSYGQVIVIQHANNLISLYAHMSEMNVNIGDKVKQGDVIGKVGNTGRSTGPHLHLEIRKDGEHVNPENYITFKE